jgi:hypothetical protein
MTVRRDNTEKFSIDKDSLLTNVLKVLRRGQRGYRYVDTVVNEDRTRVQTRVKPWLWPLLLSTPMTLEVAAQDDGSCDLTVSTRSQLPIHGDIFGCYDRYIASLLRSVRSLNSATERVSTAPAAP